MLSSSSFDSPRILETTFITGISYQNIIEYSKHPRYSLQLIPDILFSYPQKKETINSSILEFIFPSGISVEYSNQKSKFHSIVLTNETGCRTYLYVLKLYEEVPLNEIITHKDDNTNTKANVNVFQNQIQTIKVDNNKALYFPYAICILSSLPQVESFKKILLEMLRVMSFSGIHSSEESVSNYRHCELLHMMIFLSNIIKPSNHTRLILNFHYSSVQLHFSSFNEIPSDEYNMKLLFDSLEISTIIKLWCSILCEKHIILLANQPIVLFSIGEALLNLIFPFKWLHTYISVLPNEQLDYLESPTPYIMGVLSSRVDYCYLNETYSTHVICDINTSEINQNGISTLSQSEEAKLRKKLQYMKNPDLFEVEDVDYEDYSDSIQNKQIEIEDVDRTHSFSNNIQHIFFRVFKNGLNIMKSNLNLDSTFNVQSFLVDYCSEDMKEFWEKLSSTVAFEHFILSFTSLDISYSRIFKNITMQSMHASASAYTSGNNKHISSTHKETGKKATVSQDKLSIGSPLNVHMCWNAKNDIFICEINLPKTFNEITDQFDNSISEFRHYLQKLNADYSNVFTQIRSSIKAYNEKQKVSFPHKTNVTNMSGSMTNLVFETTKEREDIVPPAKDWPPSKYAKQIGNAIGAMSVPQSLIIHNTKLIDKKSTFNQNRESIISQLKQLDKKKSAFRIYGQNAFLSFLKFVFKSMIPVNELGYGQHFLSQALQLLSLKEEAHFKLFNCSQVVELDYEDYDSLYLRSSASDDKKELISFNNCDCYQYYQLLAFIIAEYSQVEHKDKIIKLYEHSYALNAKGFCRARFYQYLDRYNYYELTYLLNKMETEHLEINKKLLVKIIKMKLQKLQKNKRLSNKFTNSPVVLQSPLIVSNNEVIEELNENKSSYSDSSDMESDEKSELIGRNSNKLKNEKQSKSRIGNTNTNTNTNRNDELITSNVGVLTRQINEQSSKKDDSCVGYLASPNSNNNNNSNSNTNNRNSNGILKRKSTNDLRNFTYLRSMKRMSSTLSDNRNRLFNDNFDGLTDGEKIIEILKAMNEVSSKDRLIKINVMNVYETYTSTNKDPISLIEDISVELFSLLIRKAMNKLQSDMISNKLLLSLSNCIEFIRIKKLVAELQAVNVVQLRNQDKNHICFWLNAFNFLTLFAIIYKREVPLTYYDWYRFLKNSYFNIGGFDISLYEIENCILRNNKTRMWINGEACDFLKEDKRNVLKIKHVPRQTFFCLALPTASSPNLKIYFPSTLNKLMTLNAIEYVNSTVAVDAKNYAISIPEYLTWIDDDYSTHLLKYKEIFSKDFFEMLEKSKSNANIEKYDWSINFRNMTN